MGSNPSALPICMLCVHKPLLHRLRKYLVLQPDGLLIIIVVENSVVIGYFVIRTEVLAPPGFLLNYPALGQLSLKVLLLLVVFRVLVENFLFRRPIVSGSSLAPFHLSP